MRLGNENLIFSLVYKSSTLLREGGPLNFYLGGMYKPRGQTRGEGEFAQMTTTLNNSYLVKVSTWGRGVKIAQNSVHVVCTRPLTL